MHKKNNTILLFVGLFLIFLGITTLLYYFNEDKQEITISEKMKECIVNGGEFSVYDHSLRDDGSDYRATCEIPEHNLWQYDFE